MLSLERGAGDHIYIGDTGHRAQRREENPIDQMNPISTNGRDGEGDYGRSYGNEPTDRRPLGARGSGQ